MTYDAYRKSIEDAIIDLLSESERKLVLIDINKLRANSIRDLLWSIDDQLHYQVLQGQGEKGERTLHISITKSRNVSDEVSRLILTIEEYSEHLTHSTRETIHKKFGKLLGYSEESCIEFSKSYEGRNCPCTICGGTPQTQEAN